jgi:hypothetical protein
MHSHALFFREQGYILRGEMLGWECIVYMWDNNVYWRYDLYVASLHKPATHWMCNHKWPPRYSSDLLTSYETDCALAYCRYQNKQHRAETGSESQLGSLTDGKTLTWRDRKTDRQTGRQTPYLKKDCRKYAHMTRQTKRQSDRQPCRRKDRQKDKKLMDRLSDVNTHRWTNGKTNRRTVGLADWLTDGRTVKQTDK